ncbi:glutathione S-transferase family protein, partial [Phenylobacterium sp.]|uniref:glutathione S-transferase family protein n=1 Tax=Phenylobacterium sp. TaxID=1871053 RepID=UPI0030F45585
MTDRILHHFPLDPASRQVRLALGEKRLAFTEQTVRYWERPKELVSLNASGLTPVLTEGDLVLCESRAILDHLEETYPEPALLGREPGERAEARRLLQWFDRKFDNEVNGFLLHEKMEKRLLRLGAPDLSSLRRGREALRHHLAYV